MTLKAQMWQQEILMHLNIFMGFYSIFTNRQGKDLSEKKWKPAGFWHPFGILRTCGES